VENNAYIGCDLPQLNFTSSLTPVDSATLIDSTLTVEEQPTVTKGNHEKSDLLFESIKSIGLCEVNAEPVGLQVAEPVMETSVPVATLVENVSQTLSALTIGAVNQPVMDSDLNNTQTFSNPRLEDNCPSAIGQALFDINQDNCQATSQDLFDINPDNSQATSHISDINRPITGSNITVSETLKREAVTSTSGCSAYENVLVEVLAEDKIEECSLSLLIKTYDTFDVSSLPNNDCGLIKDSSLMDKQQATSSYEQQVTSGYEIQATSSNEQQSSSENHRQAIIGSYEGQPTSSNEQQSSSNNHQQATGSHEHQATSNNEQQSSSDNHPQATGSHEQLATSNNEQQAMSKMNWKSERPVTGTCITSPANITNALVAPRSDDLIILDDTQLDNDLIILDDSESDKELDDTIHLINSSGSELVTAPEQSKEALETLLIEQNGNKLGKNEEIFPDRKSAKNNSDHSMRTEIIIEKDQCINNDLDHTNSELKETIHLNKPGVEMSSTIVRADSNMLSSKSLNTGTNPIIVGSQLNSQQAAKSQRDIKKTVKESYNVSVNVISKNASKTRQVAQNDNDYQEDIGIADEPQIDDSACDNAKDKNHNEGELQGCKVTEQLKKVVEPVIVTPVKVEHPRRVNKESLRGGRSPRDSNSMTFWGARNPPTSSDSQSVVSDGIMLSRAIIRQMEVCILYLIIHSFYIYIYKSFIRHKDSKNMKKILYHSEAHRVHQKINHRQVLVQVYK